MKKLLLVLLLLASEGFAQSIVLPHYKPSTTQLIGRVDSLQAVLIYKANDSSSVFLNNGVSFYPHLFIPDSTQSQQVDGALYRVGSDVYMWYHWIHDAGVGARIQLSGAGGGGASSALNLGGTYGWYSSTSGGVLGFRGFTLSPGGGLVVSGTTASSYTLSTDPTILARLPLSNTFTMPQSITANASGADLFTLTNTASTGNGLTIGQTSTGVNVSLTNLGTGDGLHSTVLSGLSGYFRSITGTAGYFETSSGTGIYADVGIGNGIVVDVTSGTLMNLRQNGTTRFYVDGGGSVTAVGMNAQALRLIGSYANWSLPLLGTDGAFFSLAPGVSGTYLKSNGTSLSWATVAGGSGGVPAYGGDSSKYLGNDSSWHSATVIQSNNGEVLYDSSGTIRSRPLEAYVKIDSVSLTTSGQYDIMYSNRKVHIDSLIIVNVSTGSPSVVFNLRYSADRSLGGTALINSPSATTNTTTGARTGGFDNPHVPAGNWIWITTPTVTTKPFRALVVVKYTYE